MRPARPLGNRRPASSAWMRAPADPERLGRSHARTWGLWWPLGLIWRGWLGAFLRAQAKSARCGESRREEPRIAGKDAVSRAFLES